MSKRKTDEMRPRTPEEEEERAVLRLLSYTWEILSESDRDAALQCARVQGEVWVEEFGGAPDDLGYAEAYRRSAIRLAFETEVINDVEYECWRYQRDDARVDAFRKGVNAALGH